MLSRVAQKEQDLRSSGIRIRSLAPGVVDTEMQERIRLADNNQFSQIERFQSYYEKGELAEPAVVASKILHWLQRPFPDTEATVLRIEAL
jgi:benzil reductase ((S)-benzoin forming)